MEENSNKALEQTEREELKHFINIIYAFMSYKRDGSVDVERIYRSFNLLSGDDKALLIESPPSRTIKILKALIKNQDFIIAMISGIVDLEKYTGKLDKFYAGNKYTDEEVKKEVIHIIRNTPFCNCPDDLEDDEIKPTSDPLVLQRNVNWVRSTLRQFVRDWSVEGEKERDQCFRPLLDALQRRVPIRDLEDPPLILCPGSGLGRLPFEVLRLGYSSQGNEFSYFMLIGICLIAHFFVGSHFVINHAIRPNAFKIYPYCLDTSNRISKEDHLKEVDIPDVSPGEFKLDRQKFSICAGEFIEAYEGFSEHFDGVLTSFFLDTAKNIISYIRTIARLTKRGALWANMGPLLYHYADLTHNSIELPWEEVRTIISNWFTIDNFDVKEAYYTSNSLSMMKTQYKCIYFEATRNEVPVSGQSNTF
ncbi:Mg protoporphyrin IX chelatase [Theileria orientalis strain Shintoku]|uniref:carnosine N-methyltransferase n=1 Tax=Theileria orientalis strain Shintoku TaxID=869250 RepID=J4DP51_THEOR|nr:Mg protoporphyrin IX chelatase [Theileria orientalis strain Shintoku]BAM40099.1 Mg protoporphyrin IX chelatase [Theileria orientalis strain Shintoku]|eukprot:XP_009690400.1 Mg protoporphyrin IX chelatase [Theileria orientalis strain Shintoku]